LVALIKDIIRLLRLSAEQKALALTTTIDPAVPVHVAGDAARLRQVLVNLLNNAIKFTEKGAVNLEVRGHSLAGAQWRLDFAVHDTGIGIPTDAYDRLFQPFSQVDASTTRRFGGTGLGLAISRRLVELMGGEIGAKSIEGAGSTFHFSIVVKDASADRESASPAYIDGEQPLTATTAPSQRTSLRILLAEDNLLNQKVAVRILQRLGYTATVVNNGREALNAAKNAEYDVILMDLHMPEMNGLDAARAIRQELAADRQPTIIALTADTGEGSGDQSLAAGMDAVVFKPIEVGSLADALGKVNARLPAGEQTLHSGG
jgi:CheY-like chemotaxis protein